MAAGSLLALLDDIATILDDVSVMTQVAAKKTAGVLGDDLALNAQQVSGVHAERELPVVWAVAKGSFLNKLILVPSALAISYFAPWIITPLLMVGGVSFLEASDDTRQGRLNVFVVEGNAPGGSRDEGVELPRLTGHGLGQAERDKVPPHADHIGKGVDVEDGADEFLLGGHERGKADRGRNAVSCKGGDKGGLGRDKHGQRKLGFNRG